MVAHDFLLIPLHHEVSAVLRESQFNGGDKQYLCPGNISPRNCQRSQEGQYICEAMPTFSLDIQGFLATVLLVLSEGRKK